MTLVAETPLDTIVRQLDPLAPPPPAAAPDPQPDPATTPVKQMVIVNWSGELDRIWPTLILASSAAASGVQCKVFVTFWGLLPSSGTGSGSPAPTGSSGCCRR